MVAFQEGSALSINRRHPGDAGGVTVDERTGFRLSPE